MPSSGVGNFGRSVPICRKLLRAYRPNSSELSSFWNFYFRGKMRKAVSLVARGFPSLSSSLAESVFLCLVFSPLVFLNSFINLFHSLSNHHPPFPIQVNIVQSLLAFLVISSSATLVINSSATVIPTFSASPPTRLRKSPYHKCQM